MKKSLKFAPALIPLILNGTKNSTWRIQDDKDLKTGDKLDLLHQHTKEKFSEAVIISVIEKKMGNLTPEDKKGHEKFSSDQEMFDTYTKYYKLPVDKHTEVKIIRFKLI